jgi:GTP cyclohydrolase I
MSNKLPDVQENEKPNFNIPINFVGIENFKLPFKLKLRDSDELIDLIAKTEILTNVSANKKGISMSRLLLSIQPFLNDGLCWETLKKCLDNTAKLVVSDSVNIKMSFDLPIIKKSPLSDHEFPVYYPCSFEGYKDYDIYNFYQSVNVQYSSYCPCSAALAKELSQPGFPHAQRSFAEIVIKMDLNNKKQIWLEDIIDLVLNNIKTQPYPIIKRIDEQEISKIASENPLFVEDAIRIISNELNKMDSLIDWSIKCIHEESIHNHNAIAINWKYGM